MQQARVPGLRREAGEAGGDLGVEDVREGRAPGAAQDRDVLAARVQDHLDRGVGEHLRQRSGIAEILLQRVEHDDLLADADLHEAEQRAIAALGHELRVDPEPPLLAGACGET